MNRIERTSMNTLTETQPPLQVPEFNALGLCGFEFVELASPNPGAHA